MSFKPYLHIERLGTGAVEGITRGHVYVTPKLDGTNASIWYDVGCAQFKCGSRTRELSTEADNANFATFVEESMDDYMVRFRAVCAAHDVVLFGEWLGGVTLDGGRKLKFTGSIKDYLEGGFYLFDVFDNGAQEYIPRDDSIWEELGQDHVVPILAELDDATSEQLMEIADNNHYNLPANVVGEGIVVKNYAYRDSFGHFQEAKVVRAEWHENKKKKRVAPENLEEEFVDTYCTPAYLDKCANKARLYFDADEFVTADKRMVGMMFSRVPIELVEENIAEFVRKKKMPRFDFGKMSNLAKARVRDFLSL